MTKEELITKQQLEIEDLKVKLSELQEAIKAASAHFTCIGGPLNDNFLEFDKRQIGLIYKANQELESVIESDWY